MNKDHDCIFCKMKDDNILDNDLAFALPDRFPVTPGHTLIIPKRHFPDYFDLSKDELYSLHQLIIKRKDQLIQLDSSISGFNIGINSGRVAGQTVMHLHVHLIPRRVNDSSDPTGGVRCVIAGKQKY